MSDKDLLFISGKFFHYDIPKNKKYLLNFYKTDLQRAWLKYYLTFGNFKCFIDHTGHYCTRRFLFRMLKRFRYLVKLYSESKISLTEEGMEMILKLESGKLNLTEYGIS